MDFVKQSPRSHVVYDKDLCEHDSRTDQTYDAFLQRVARFTHRLRRDMVLQPHRPFVVVGHSRFLSAMVHYMMRQMPMPPDMPSCWPNCAIMNIVMENTCATPPSRCKTIGCYDHGENHGEYLMDFSEYEKRDVLAFNAILRNAYNLKPPWAVQTPPAINHMTAATWSGIHTFVGQTPPPPLRRTRSTYKIDSAERLVPQ